MDKNPLAIDSVIPVGTASITSSPCRLVHAEGGGLFIDLPAKVLANEGEFIAVVYRAVEGVGDI